MKILLIVLVILAYCSLNNSAISKPYISLNYRFNHLDMVYENNKETLGNYVNYSDNYLSYRAHELGFGIGNDMGKYSIETSYFSKSDFFSKETTDKSRFFHEDSKVLVYSKSSLEIIDLDLIYNLQLLDKIYLMSLVGISHIKYGYEITHTNLSLKRHKESFEKKGFGTSVGFGIKRSMSNKLDIGLMIKYIKIFNIEVLDGIMSYSAFARYHF